MNMSSINPQPRKFRPVIYIKDLASSSRPVIYINGQDWTPQNPSESLLTPQALSVLDKLQNQYCSTQENQVSIYGFSTSQPDICINEQYWAPQQSRQSLPPQANQLAIWGILQNQPIIYFNGQHWTPRQPCVPTQANHLRILGQLEMQPIICINGKFWFPQQSHQSVPTRENQFSNLSQLQSQASSTQANQGSILGQLQSQASSAQVNQGSILGKRKNQECTTFAPIYVNQATNILKSLNSDTKGAPSHMIQTDIDYEKKIEEFESELSKIVGLEDLKLQLRKWSKGLLMDVKRRAMGKRLGPKKAPHMAFLGNPGTGKTTVARILGKLLHCVGFLSCGEVIEVQRTDLVGSYIGETGPKTRKKINEAEGNVLFVDEAYRLIPYEGGKDYGKEALEEIMSSLEDDNRVVIFAGYKEPMKSVFSANEGFRRRVTHFFEFNDFSCHELTEMLMIKMKKQDEKSPLFGFELHPSCTFEAIRQVIENNSSVKLRNEINGGLVDHMLNKAKESLDSRLSFNSTDNGDELMTITLDDLVAGLQLLAQSMKGSTEEYNHPTYFL